MDPNGRRAVVTGMASETPEVTPRSRYRLLLWAALVVTLVLVGRYLNAPALLRRALDGIAGLGPWGPPLFVVLDILATVLFLPGWILTLGAGVVFGVIKGSILVSVGATLGAMAAFLVGRYLARGWVAGRTDGTCASRPLTGSRPGRGGRGIPRSSSKWRRMARSRIPRR